MKMKAYALFVLALRHLFLWSSSHSVKKKKKKNRQIVEEVWTMTEQMVRSKEDKPRSGWPFFHKLCEKYYRKSCK